MTNKTEALKPCPFCGGEAVWQSDGGSYGYTSPTLWITCVNEPFDNPDRTKRGFLDKRVRCFAKTWPKETQEWAPGKGTFSIAPAVKVALIAAWNARTTGEDGA